MIRKWTTVFLSLMLALMLPLCALADTKHTLQLVPGDELASEAAIADLLKVLSISVTTGDESGALTISLDDLDVATLGVAADSTGLYVHSDLLSDDVLYVTWDDGFAFVTDLLLMSLGEEGADAASLEAVETSMIDLKASVVTAFANAPAPAQSVTAATQEEEWAALEEMFGDDPKMMEYLQGVKDKLIVEDGMWQSENRDAADQKYSMTLTSEDMLKICDSEYMRTIIAQVMSADAGDATQEEINAAVEETLAQTRQIFTDSQMLYTMEMYTLDEGMTLVGMDLAMNMNMVAEEETLNAAMTLGYSRLTGTDGVTHTGTMKMSTDEEEMAEVQFKLERGNNDVSKGMLGFLVDGEEIVITYHGENTAPDTREREAAIYYRSGASAILEPAASARPLFGFVLTTQPADEQLLAKLENADSSTSVNVMKLSAEEMQALGEEISGRAMQALYSALGKLPTSTLNLFMGEMQ